MSMMGELSFFLRLQIQQISNGALIHQTKYIKEYLKNFRFKNVKTKYTPMSTTINLDNDINGKLVDIKHYRSMIGSLLYLIASRPDILFAVCLRAHFQSKPKESHMSALKWIFCLS